MPVSVSGSQPTLKSHQRQLVTSCYIMSTHLPGLEAGFPTTHRSLRRTGMVRFVQPSPRRPLPTASKHAQHSAVTSITANAQRTAAASAHANPTHCFALVSRRSVVAAQPNRPALTPPTMRSVRSCQAAFPAPQHSRTPSSPTVHTSRRAHTSHLAFVVALYHIMIACLPRSLAHAHLSWHTLIT